MAKSTAVAANVEALQLELNETLDLIQWLETRWNIGPKVKAIKVDRMAQVLCILKESAAANAPLSKTALCNKVSTRFDPISMGSLSSQLSYLKDPSRKDKRGGHVWYMDDISRYVYRGCIFDPTWDAEARRTA